MESNKQIRLIKPHNGDPVSSVSTMESTNSVLSFALKFQSQLCIDSLIQTYEECIQSILKIKGICYRYPLLDINHTLGVTSGAKCNLHLNTDGEFWGDIALYRETKLSDKEMKDIELISSLLIHPLRAIINQKSNSLISSNEETTGVANTALVEQLAAREAKLSYRERVPMSLMLINIDRFQRVYKSTNFMTRDDLLYKVMTVMRINIRETDLLFRYINDTYCLILKGVTVNNAFNISERIRNAIDSHKFITANNEQVHITVSAGISELLSTDSIESIFERTTHAVQHAKKMGRNQSIIADGKFIS